MQNGMLGPNLPDEPVFLEADADRLFALDTAYGLGTWLPVMALNVIEGRRLVSHLKMHHPQNWGRLTCVPGLGFGMHNGFRFLRWLYSSDDFGDSTVASLKQELRRFYLWVLTVFFSYVIIMPVLLGELWN
jgi:hypothetical protein